MVGDVIGKYHPHGDQSIYDALVRMAQPFSMHLPLIEGQGNFGSVDGDPPAAMRYTEVRMEKISQHLLNDLDKETVDFQENYDNSESEPIVIPAEFPNLLVNGAGGIAVGMATNIPPHNLGEITDACLLLLDKPEASIDELIEIVPGPDFPTGGIILGQSGSRSAYSTGKGSIARFAIDDYYKPIKKFIEKLKDHFDTLDLRTQEFIDSPSHYDRLFFEGSGLGWQGKSSMMLSPSIGPWQLIGNLYVEMKFETPVAKSYSCGNCNMCQISCPTGALDNEYKIDSRKCISYWLQSPEIIPHEIRIKIANRFYGCDDCLTSCPPGQNKFISLKQTKEVDLEKIINMDKDNLISKFEWFYVPQRNGDYLKRNAIIALANNPDENSHELFIKLLDSDSDIIRLYSIWALWRIGMLDKVNEESFIKKEVSSDVKKEFERLKK